MASPFELLDRQVQKSVLDLDGEAFLMRPREHVNRGFTAPKRDSSRAPCELQGIFSTVPAEARMKGSRQNSDVDGSTRINTSDHELWLPAEEFEKVDGDVVKGDVFFRPKDECDYTVIRVKPTEQGDVYLELVKEAPS